MIEKGSVRVPEAPDSLRVQVEYYNEEERQALLSSPLASALVGVPRQLNIDTPEFCAYYLYYKMNPSFPGFRNRSELARRWAEALVELNGQVRFRDSSLQLESSDQCGAGTIERLGEAVGLSVASKLHGLHQADWTRIPVSTSRKTLDFEHPWESSDGTLILQLETKGSAAGDTDAKTSAVSNLKSNIKKKKHERTSDERRAGPGYGMISVLGSDPSSIARCLLVDPPGDDRRDPFRFKVIARLRFIADLISFVSENSPFAAALQTRLASLIAHPDIGPSNRVPLTSGAGEEFFTNAPTALSSRHPFLANKSVVSDGPAGGQVFLAGQASVLFIGLRADLIDFAARQDFDDIAQYKFSAGTIEKDVDCCVPAGRFHREFEPTIRLPEGTRASKGQYVKFRLRGLLQYSQSGLVLGALTIPPEMLQRESGPT